MKYINLLIILSFIVTGALAENDNGQTRAVKIMPRYQNWTISGGTEISELSIPVLVYFSIRRDLSISLRGSQANIGGNVTGLNGITDTQIAFQYRLEAANLVFNTGFNFPSGKRELTPEEFQTSSLLSFNYFNFQVPNFGQGLNISPGLTWALPVNDNFVLGMGASYQYKGKFKPVKDMSDDYKPGDEILVTGGIDLRFLETATFSADLIYITYGTDKIGSHEVFASGNLIVANIQLRYYLGHHQFWGFARYRSKAKNSLAVAGALVPESQKTSPDQIEAMGQFRIRCTPNLYTGILAEGRSYLPTPTFTGADIFGVGIMPEIVLSPDITIPMRFEYLFGDFVTGPTISGWEIGLGLSFQF